MSASYKDKGYFKEYFQYAEDSNMFEGGWHLKSDIDLSKCTQYDTNGNIIYDPNKKAQEEIDRALERAWESNR